MPFPPGIPLCALTSRRSGPKRRTHVDESTVFLRVLIRQAYTRSCLMALYKV